MSLQSLLIPLSSFTFHDFIIFFIIAIVAYTFKFYYTYFTRENKLPGPFPLPLIGNLYFLYRELDDILFDLQEKYRSGLFEFYIDSERKICIGDAKLLKEINKYSSNTKFKSHAEFELDELAGLGIGFNNNLESWKNNKAFLIQSVITPSFWKKYIKEIEMIFENSINLVECKQKSASFEIDFKE
ncbi:1067_t:CDS:1 [Racocetra persica]|uniref:1067_t:CDS:1 n=1 Tax=Racocetra persica TaxID=160502 RepID=A0ACA9KMY2_9GLOM|nr:1067_t:CDS:1 [Racocetra persica]